VMWVMVFAYLTYLINAAQFVKRGIESARFRRATALAQVPVSQDETTNGQRHVPSAQAIPSRKR